ncbi:MAG: RNA polymerase sigma factor [Acidobacteriota bacterium]
MNSSDFECRLQQYYRLVYRIAYNVLRNAAEAEDISQEVFLQAYHKLSSLRDPRKFKAWVARMSYRLALNQRRSLARSRHRDWLWQEGTDVQRPNEESLIVDRERSSQLRAHIEQLPERLRSVLWLSAIQELEARDIARILRIPAGTVRSRLHLARKMLLKRFESEKL